MHVGREANNGDNRKIIPRVGFLMHHLIFCLCHEPVMLHYIKSWFHFISEYPIVASLLFACSLQGCNCRIKPPSACCLTGHVSIFHSLPLSQGTLVNKQIMGYANHAYRILNAFSLLHKAQPTFLWLQKHPGLGDLWNTLTMQEKNAHFAFGNTHNIINNLHD